MTSLEVRFKGRNSQIFYDRNKSPSYSGICRDQGVNNACIELQTLRDELFRDDMLVTDLFLSRKYYFIRDPPNLHEISSNHFLKEDPYIDTIPSDAHRVIITPIDGSTYSVFVKVLTGKTMTIDAHLDGTVGYLKKQIEDREGIPPSQQWIAWSGKIIQSNMTLDEYDIHKESTLHLVSRLRAEPPIGDELSVELTVESNKGPLTISTTTLDDILNQLVTEYDNLQQSAIDTEAEGGDGGMVMSVNDDNENNNDDDESKK